MEKNTCRILEWMSATLTNEPVADISEDEWPVFSRAALSHNLTNILFPVIHKTVQYKPDEIYSLWKSRLLQETLYRLNTVYKIDEIVQSFKENNLQLIIIKGPALARLYNPNQCRSMGDLDILVRSDETDRAKKLLESMGYSYQEDEDEGEHPVHWAYTRLGGLYVELHRTLLNPMFLGKRSTQRWMKSIWDNSRISNYEGIEFRALSAEDELINQILHLATHLVYGSAKIKNIYDIALLIKSNNSDLNWCYVNEILSELRLSVFSKLIFRICNKYLASEIPDYLLMSGNNMKKHISPEEFLERFIFLTDKVNLKGWRVISWEHPYLCKHQALMPLILIIEFYFEMKKSGGKLKDSINNSINNTKNFSYTGRSLKRLGLSI